jgi:hypothetical protein
MEQKLQSNNFNNCHLLMTLKIGLHIFFLEMSKNVGQDSVSGITRKI